jgi:phospholipid transport system transporter-binding protein
VSAIPTQIVRSAQGRFAVTGALTFATARRAFEVGVRTFAAEEGKSLVLDCSGVSAGDSAGLAVLLQWVGWAQRQQRLLSFLHVPAAIEAMARISDVEDLLPRAAA